jgi:hypothetical protein
MNDAWRLAWDRLSHGEWHDATPLATWIAAEVGIEVSSARGLLQQAVHHGLVNVRHQLRGQPRRWRADYRMRPRTAETFEHRAADLIERFLRTRGRREVFDPQADLAAFRAWLGNAELDTTWQRSVEGAGLDTDADLLASIRRTNPRLVSDPRGSAGVGVLPAALPQGDSDDGEDEAVLVRDPAKPTAGELTDIKLRALRLVAAVAGQDWGAAYHLRPRSTVDGGYMTTALAELVVELATDAGHPLGAWVEQVRAATVRAQARAGRP